MDNYIEKLRSFLISENICNSETELYESIGNRHNKYKIIEDIFLFDIKSYGYLNVLRGDGYFGYKMLSLLWKDKESELFKESILRPFINRVLETPDEDYEIDVHDSSIRKANVNKLINLISYLLNKIYFHNFLSDDIITLFKNINIQVCMQVSDSYPKLIGGLLILRLINPMFCMPWDYSGIDKTKFSPKVLRALILVGKSLQLISCDTNSQGYMICLSDWLEQQKITWGIFFRKKFEIYDLQRENILTSALESKHREIISFLFELDNTKDYESKTNLGANCTNYYKSIKTASNNLAILSKTEFLVNAPIENVYNWTVHNTDNDKKILLEKTTIKEINANLSIKYLKYNMFLPFVSDRDVLFLEYKELFKEEKFGIICRISTEMDGIKHDKDLVRGEVKGGFIFREDHGGRTSVTHIIYTDPKGKFKRIPDKIKQYLCLRESKRLKKMSKLFDN